MARLNVSADLPSPWNCVVCFFVSSSMMTVRMPCSVVSLTFAFEIASTARAIVANYSITSLVSVKLLDGRRLIMSIRSDIAALCWAASAGSK